MQILLQGLLRGTQQASNPKLERKTPMTTATQSSSYTVQTAVIREVQCLVRIPTCADTRETLGLESLAELRERLAAIPDYRQVVARLKVRVHLWEPSMVSVQFTAIKADGTVGGFSMDRDGNVTTVWVYVRL